MGEPPLARAPLAEGAGRGTLLSRGFGLSSCEVGDRGIFQGSWGVLGEGAVPSPSSRGLDAVAFSWRRRTQERRGPRRLSPGLRLPGGWRQRACAVGTSPSDGPGSEASPACGRYSLAPTPRPTLTSSPVVQWFRSPVSRRAGSPHYPDFSQENKTTTASRHPDAAVPPPRLSRACGHGAEGGAPGPDGATPTTPTRLRMPGRWAQGLSAAVGSQLDVGSARLEYAL
ncbi:uncharacterized protein LOC134807381 [Pan troglodytes]|uniref:uncharacterized protein LOC134807381 n=1 Tax=Pan troglodytes TaxID=9598 RepID=UPI003013DF82